ncbi:MAG TPA: hypothetical protein DEF45_10860 [Rhodopirellula sp.]|nr:MAG: hypothetical protein CBD74_11955 [Saprospirales bacterium TMED214]HBV63510.1 hypothetical protein [Rhodopirellula sp.]
MGFGGPKKGDQEKIVIQSQIQVQTQDGKKTVFSNYQTEGFFDELIDEQGRPRPDAEQLVRLINQMQPAELVRRHRVIERSMYQMGITFTVYSDAAGTEKIMPFDIVPRIISSLHWHHIEAGLKQRIKALNCFLADIYSEQQIIHDGILPRELVESASTFLPECMGFKPFHDVWCHVTGTDLIRDDSGAFYVLEDNLRCPSGVSYVLQNRQVMKKNFPQIFSASRVRPVSDYPARLYQMLLHMAPPHVDDPTVVVLTPGRYNSAYYEHSFLSQQMGVELVEGSDLIVEDENVYMRTTQGLQKIDVIYRRIDDTFLDPEVFLPDSLLGVRGLMRAYRAGNVALANAPGTGVADDKVIYAYVPDMIRYYLGESQIIPNVPTYVCLRDDDRKYVLEHMDELVIKAADESGGYGILIGPHASRSELSEYAERIKANPRKFVAQPTLSLSRVPTMAGHSLEGRHVDLRPYILCGANDVWVMPGGLTRVALRKGCLVVNSSQGGGSKDTWVASEPGQAVASP